MCSNCGVSHPDEGDFVNGFNKRRQERMEPFEDALGQDAFQVLLAVSYERYMHKSLANLIGHRAGPSFVPRRNP